MRRRRSVPLIWIRTDHSWRPWIDDTLLFQDHLQDIGYPIKTKNSGICGKWDFKPFDWPDSIVAIPLHTRGIDLVNTSYNPPPAYESQDLNNIQDLHRTTKPHFHLAPAHPSPSTSI